MYMFSLFTLVVYCDIMHAQFSVNLFFFDRSRLRMETIEKLLVRARAYIILNAFVISKRVNKSKR